MKNNNIITVKFGLIMAVVVMAFAVLLMSCEDDNKNNLNDFDIGGLVRFAEAFPIVVDVSDLSEVAGVEIPITLETPDNNVVSYSMEVSATVGGALYDYEPYGAEITSFPTSITITMTEIAAILDIDVNDIGFGDTFDFKGTAVNDKGIVYSSERMNFDTDTKEVTGGNSTDDLLDEQGYRQAFEFGFAIPCPPETGDFAGDWIISFTDLYGDGWDGAFISAEIDGVVTTYTLADGATGTAVITVPAGTTALRFSYTPGNWEEEHVYTIETPSGEIIGPIGPNPPLCIQ